MSWPVPLVSVSLLLSPSSTLFPRPPESASSPPPPRIISCPLPPVRSSAPDWPNQIVGCVLSAPVIVFPAALVLIRSMPVNISSVVRPRVPESEMTSMSRCPVPPNSLSPAPRSFAAAKKVSFPSPPNTMSAPLAAISLSLPSPPRSRLSPSPPIRISLPTSPNSRSSSAWPRMTSSPWPP